MTRRYIGRQLDDGSARVDVCTADRVSPLVDRDDYRSRSFGWGGTAVGSVSLARAILSDVLGVETGEGMAVIFAGDVLARLPGEAFALDEEEVRDWLATQHERRLTSAELVEHLGSIALAAPEEEAEVLRGLVDRCWTGRALVN
jgi:hypothetical protein